MHRQRQNASTGQGRLNWVITGGCGFLGTALVHSLMEEGEYRIRVVDNLSVGTRRNLRTVCEYQETSPDAVCTMPPRSGSAAVELIVGDILDDSLALKAAAGADVIVHLAANTGVASSVEDPRDDCLANVVGTLNYLEAARSTGVGRFVLASSGAPVGECDPPMHEELAPHPVSPYGASKLAGEGYCSAYFHTFGLETVALRFGNVYGPLSDHKDSAVAKFIKRAVRGETLDIYGDGKQTRDFVYVEDLVRAVRLAARTEGVGGEIFQIATNAETTVEELLDKLVPALAKAGIERPTVRHTSPRRGDVSRNYSDTSKARRMLGWSATVGLEEGLGRTVSYYCGSSADE